MEKSKPLSCIDDRPITYEEARERSKKLVEKIHAREALKRECAENAAERAVV